MKKINKNGFTLFELLVSISIIAIMTALASVAFSGAQKKARDARRVQDLKLVQIAAEQYYSQNKYVYPSSSANYVAGVAWTGSGATSILESYPSDPKENGTTYSYDCKNTGCSTTGYFVCTTVENPASSGNTTAAFVFTAPSVSTTLFCIKNQQ